MKIISWNVNGIRAVEKKGFIDWVSASDADVICIQETKAHQGQLSPLLVNPPVGLKVKENYPTPLSKEALEMTERGEYHPFESLSTQNSEQKPGFESETVSGTEAGNPTYYSYWSSAKRPGYSGTAIYCKTKPDAVETMGIPEFDDEGRVTLVKYGTTTIISAYFPNSQEGGARLGYKLDFCKAMKGFCDKLVSQGYNIILCGDYNIAHKPIDLANPKSNEKNAGYLPEERDWMEFFTTHGYCDTFRKFCQDPGQYTWWSYRFKAREKNIGWRIDYHCVNDSFADNVISSTILPSVMGSDHCPIQLHIED